MNKIDQKMEEGVKTGVYPGAALWVRYQGSVIHERHYYLSNTTWFDLASLTKPLATVNVAMALVNEGVIQLGQESAYPGVTVKHLLEHSSGLPDWKPYYKQLIPLWEKGEPVQDKLFKLILEEPLLSSPGAKRLYSDLGFILLQKVLEDVTQQSLKHLYDTKVKTLLHISELDYCPLNGQSSYTYAETGSCSWRHRLLCGEVHDDHAALLGGVAGHAGLFGTLKGVAEMVEKLVEVYAGNGSWLSQEVLHNFIGPQRRWALGWDRPEGKDSQAGQFFSKNSIGHLGYTGCSLWMDWEQDWQVILLTNRVHPDRENNKIKQFRPELHDIIYETIT
jgi:serine-type D-Ala-D-Ala carboxypeptidase